MGASEACLRGEGVSRDIYKDICKAKRKLDRNLVKKQVGTYAHRQNYFYFDLS